MKGSLNPGEKFQWGPLWDKDLAYGNYSTVPKNKLVADYDKTSFEYVFKSSWKGNGLFANKLFLQLFKSKYDQLVDDGLYDKLCADIDRLAATVDNTQKQNYQKLLKMVRQHNPKAKIVFLTGSMLYNEELKLQKQLLDEVTAEAQQAGDKEVYRFDMAPISGEAFYGNDWHPNIYQDEKMAGELTAYLRVLMNWF